MWELLIVPAIWLGIFVVAWLARVIATAAAGSKAGDRAGGIVGLTLIGLAFVALIVVHVTSDNRGRGFEPEDFYRTSRGR